MAKVGGSPKRLSKRWLRHWLSLHGPSGIRPLPLRVWLAFPERGCLSCYEIGYVRCILLNHVRPKDLDMDSVENLRFFYGGFDETLERLLRSLVKMHLNYLRWYVNQVFDTSGDLDGLLHPPINPRKIQRSNEESQISRYGIIFRLWDEVRLAPVILALECLDLGVRDFVETRIFALRSGITQSSHIDFQTRESLIIELAP